MIGLTVYSGIPDSVQPKITRTFAEILDDDYCEIRFGVSSNPMDKFDKYKSWDLRHPIYLTFSLEEARQIESVISRMGETTKICRQEIPDVKSTDTEKEFYTVFVMAKKVEQELATASVA